MAKRDSLSRVLHGQVYISDKKYNSKLDTCWHLEQSVPAPEEGWGQLQAVLTHLQ